MTSVSKKEAKKYLSENKWNFQNALNMFYDHGSQPSFTEIDQNPDVENFFHQFSSKN